MRFLIVTSRMPRTNRWNTRFGRFTARFGVTRLAAELTQHGAPVTPSAVYKWIAGRHAPRPEVMESIASLSRGRVSLQDILSQRASESSEERSHGE